MYDETLYQRISEWIDGHRESMIRDIRRLVRIPSISEQGTAEQPFGKNCREAMDLMLQIGREHGFHTENYEYYVGSIGNKEKTGTISSASGTIWMSSRQGIAGSFRRLKRCVPAI